MTPTSSLITEFRIPVTLQSTDVDEIFDILPDILKLVHGQSNIKCTVGKLEGRTIEGAVTGPVNP